MAFYDTSLDVVRAVQPLLSAIGRSDPDLERQLRRAVTSVPLNIAEGSYSRGRNRNARYATATGSMREVLAGLDVAEILGYATIPLELRDRIDLVIATLVSASRSARPPRLVAPHAAPRPPRWQPGLVGAGRRDGGPA